MGEEIRVRAMESSDLERVLEIERASFTMPWTESTFRGLLRRRDAHLFVAEASRAQPDASGSAAGYVAGYAVVWVVVDQAELGDIAVERGWRGRGLGRLLLETVLDRARREGVRELFLEVRPSNEGARRLYERYGFEEVGRRRNYYSEPREDALVLRRTMERPEP
jgi:[ribosomal protein S18]-alanine N-acetyltransferase